MENDGPAPYDGFRNPLLDALESTGAIGSTVQQLARRLGTPSTEVAHTLGILARQGRVMRIGRGLWIPTEYAALDARDDFVEPADYSERFARETGVTLGRYTGPITSTQNDDLPVHRWWKYVQGFSAEFVRDQIDQAELARGARVLDPFCGGGTTLVEARLAGLEAVGCDLLPPAVLAAQVKTRFELPPTRFRARLRSTLTRARDATPFSGPFLRETRRQFGPQTLRELRQLRTALPPQGTDVGDAIRVAFDSILIPSSRLRRSPCLGYRPGGGDDLARPLELFQQEGETIFRDLVAMESTRARWGPMSRVVLGDSRELALSAESVDLAVTSPPYVNGMDYVMNYKLDLAWLGYAESYAELAQLRNRMVACDNLSRKEAEPFGRVSEVEDAWLKQILEQIRLNVAQKGNYRRQDVHSIVHRYFADLLPVVTRVFRALRPGGTFSIVVGDSLLAGTYIPGDLLLARLGARVGFRIEGVRVARERRSGQRRSFRLRESVVRLRKPGSARSSG